MPPTLHEVGSRNGALVGFKGRRPTSRALNLCYSNWGRGQSRAALLGRRQSLQFCEQICDVRAEGHRSLAKQACPAGDAALAEVSLKPSPTANRGRSATTVWATSGMPGPISTFTLQSTPSSNLKPSLAVADRALRFDFGGMTGLSPIPCPLG